MYYRPMKCSRVPAVSAENNTTYCECNQYWMPGTLDRQARKHPERDWRWAVFSVWNIRLEILRSTHSSIHRVQSPDVLRVLAVWAASEFQALTVLAAPPILPDEDTFTCYPPLLRAPISPTVCGNVCTIYIYFRTRLSRENKCTVLVSWWVFHVCGLLLLLVIVSQPS